MEVVQIRWPAEAVERRRCAREGRPRLLLVESGPPPEVDLELEDWIRLPADDGDVVARLDGLRRRAASATPPRVDDQGVLRFGGRLVDLPAVEARLAAALADRFHTVVSRQALARAGWPDAEPTRNALDVQMVRLRRRLAEVGLAVRTVRARGYLLEAEA